MDATIPLLRVGEDTAVSTLDITKTNVANELDSLCLDTLYTYSPQGSLVPSLAVSFTHPSPVTYVYDIRQGVTFWDGTPLMAADVAYSLNYERAKGSRWSFVFDSVRNVTATGPYVVTVTLSYPDASWPDDLPFGYVFEKKFAEEHQATFGQPGTLLIGSGPWEVDSLDPTRGADFTANPHWWRGTVPINKIDVSFFSTETSLALAMRAGEIDADNGVANIPAFASTSGAKMLTTPNPLGYDIFVMNTLVAPWDDVHVRRAVAYALNRTDIIAAHGGYATPQYTLIPPASLLTIASAHQVGSLMASINLYPYNLAKAKAEMAESKYPNGANVTLFEYEPGEPVTVSEVIVAELEKIGIHAQIKVAANIGSWDAIETGPPLGRLANYVPNGNVTIDPNGYLEFLLGSWNTKVGGFNESEYDPPAVDQLIKAGIGTTNDAERFAIYSALLKRLSLDVPYVPLLLDDSALALSPRFSCPTFSPYFSDGAWPLQIKSAS